MQTQARKLVSILAFACCLLSLGGCGEDGQSPGTLGEALMAKGVDFDALLAGIRNRDVDGVVNVAGPTDYHRAELLDHPT